MAAVHPQVIFRMRPSQYLPMHSGILSLGKCTCAITVHLCRTATALSCVSGIGQLHVLVLFVSSSLLFPVASLPARTVLVLQTAWGLEERHCPTPGFTTMRGA